MGILKWGLALVTMPFWGPVAAATVTTVGGVAVAAGTAVAAGATAAAGTVAAGAGAVASAAAGTAVGSAAIGTMATVGSAVGSAAGAVGLTSVAAAAGTTAGAASVGVITTSLAVGTQQGISAMGKLDDAKGIYNNAIKNYENEKKKYDPVQKSAMEAAEKLAKAKKTVAESLLEFNEIFKELKNPSRFGKIEVNSEIVKGANTNVDIKAYGIGLKKFSTGLLTACAAGQLPNLIFSNMTRSSLARLGGGTLASGGLGMAGGTMMIQGLVWAPTLAFTGIMMNGKADDALKEAREVDKEANKNVNEMRKVRPFLSKLELLCIAMTSHVNNTQIVYNKILKKLKEIVYDKKHVDVAKMTEKEIDLFYAAIGLAKVLEIQAKANFVKEKGTRKKAEDNLVKISELEAYSYKNDDLVKFGNKQNESLSRIVESVNVV